MANEQYLPLFEKIARKNTIQRALDLAVLVLLLSFLLYRLLSLNNNPGFPWLLALACESWFTIYWALLLNCKWSPVDYKTYPENLDKRFDELPMVDMFVTTADPVLESPIITVNTILSLLAADYPADKLACYVSDDGCSPLTFYSVMEASKFATLWVPFCKKYNVAVRAPSRYFLGDTKPSIVDKESEFQQDWLNMKEKYEILTGRIQGASKKPVPCDLTGDFSVFRNVGRRNHPTIIKIITDNKESHSNDVPHLVYVSREKLPMNPHNYKAGALNVLSRVSGVMTNAPFILNVDCDMYMNNPQVIRHAMCQLLESKNGKQYSFVQYPQVFCDCTEDDSYGNQFVALNHYVGHGLAGIQGVYLGSGCFHRRKIIYGLWPNESLDHASIDDNKRLKEFGESKELMNLAAQALKGERGFPKFENSFEEAFQVASSSYENGTSWGKKIGWIYGSMADDAITGLEINKRGWISTLHSTEPAAFMGYVPSGGPEAMNQQKRWATGFLEILLGKNNPIFATITANLQFRMCLAYLWSLSLPLLSIPELCYAILPAYCIITNSHFLPKVEEWSMCIPIAIVVVYSLHTLREYLNIGLSVLSWWNNIRMAAIAPTSAYLFGTLAIILKLLGISDTVFELTPKDQSFSADDNGNDDTKFTFNDSLMFVPGTTLLFIHLTALLAAAISSNPVGIGELVCSLSVILCFLPFFKGLLERGKYGIPFSIILKSAVCASLFIYVCKASRY